MKKMVVITTTLAISLSLAACGGDKTSTDTTSPTETTSESTDNTSDSVDLVEVTGNEISLKLPSDITYVKTDDRNGAMIFANDERTTVVTLGVQTDDTVTYEDITDEVLLLALSGGGELKDATLDNSVTLEQEESTSVVGFGKVTMEDGTAVHSVIQYFFPANSGVYQAISYLYPVDEASSLTYNIEDILATVTPAK